MGIKKLPGKKLRFYRAVYELSQEQLAKKARVKPHIISRIERGQMKRIPVDLAYKIARVFNRPIEEIFLSNDAQEMHIKNLGVNSHGEEQHGNSSQKTQKAL